MQATQVQEVIVEVAEQAESAVVTELRDLQLALVGGGMGIVAFG